MKSNWKLPGRLVCAAAFAVLASHGRAQSYTTVSNLVFGTYSDSNNVVQPLKLDLYLPTNAPTPMPLIIYIFGGAWQGGSRTLGPAALNPQQFLGVLGHGYALAAVDYRLSGVAKWPAQFHDVRGAVRWLRANAATYNLDPNRFGAWGFSSGAHLAEMLGLCNQPSATVGNVTVDMQGNIGGNLNVSDAIQAVCDYSGPSDLLRFDSYPDIAVTNADVASSPMGLLLGAPVQTVPELASTANPITFAHAGCAPVLIIHGTSDSVVVFNQSELLNDALARAGADVTFMANFGADHGIPSSSWINVNVTNAVYRFFDRTLKNITTNALPVAVINSSTTNGSAPLTVTFSGTNSYDSDGTISFYAWSFGDDTGGTNLATLTHTYTSAGTYTATLCVRDNAYGLRSTTRTITVNQPVHLPDTAPQISLVLPANNSVQLAPGAIYLQAGVTPGSSAVTNVMFAVDGVVLGQDLNAPYGLTVGNLSPGHHTAQARATDVNGIGANSAIVGFDVYTNQCLPLIAMVGGTNYFAVQFHRIPAATNLTHTVDASTDLLNWNNGPVYSFSGDMTNSVLATQFSRNGTNVETIIVRDTMPMNTTGPNFLRVRLTAQ